MKSKTNPYIQVVNGGLQTPPLSGFGDGYVAVDNDGNLSVSQGSGGGQGPPGPAGPAGPTGPAGANGHNGTNGQSAVFTTTSNFTQPYVGLSVSVAVSTTASMAPKQFWYITDSSGNGGSYAIQKVTDGYNVVLVNLDPPSNSPGGTTIGSGAIGVSSGIGGFRTRTVDFTALSNTVFPSDATTYTITLPDGTVVATTKANTTNEVATTFTAFTQPALSGTVSVTIPSMTVDSTMVAGFYVYHTGGGGFYKVQSVTSSTVIVLQSLGLAANGTYTVAPGSSVSGGTLLACACIVNGVGLQFMPNSGTTSSGDWYGARENDCYIKLGLTSLTNNTYQIGRPCKLWCYATFPGSITPANSYDSANFGWSDTSGFSVYSFVIKHGHIGGNVWYATSNYNSTNQGQLTNSAHFEYGVGMIDIPTGPINNIATEHYGPWSSTRGWPDTNSLLYIGNVGLVLNAGGSPPAGGSSIANYTNDFNNSPASINQVHLGAERAGGTPGLLVVFPSIRVDVPG